LKRFSNKINFSWKRNQSGYHLLSYNLLKIKAIFMIIGYHFVSHSLELFIHLNLIHNVKW